MPPLQLAASVADDMQHLVGERFRREGFPRTLAEGQVVMHHDMGPSGEAHEAINDRHDTADVAPVAIHIPSSSRGMLDRNKHQRFSETRLIKTRKLSRSVRRRIKGSVSQKAL